MKFLYSLNWTVFGYHEFGKTGLYYWLRGVYSIEWLYALFWVSFQLNSITCSITLTESYGWIDIDYGMNRPWQDSNPWPLSDRAHAAPIELEGHRPTLLVSPVDAVQLNKQIGRSWNSTAQLFGFTLPYWWVHSIRRCTFNKASRNPFRSVWNRSKTAEPREADFFWVSLWTNSKMFSIAFLKMPPPPSCIHSMAMRVRRMGGLTNRLPL